MAFFFTLHGCSPLIGGQPAYDLLHLCIGVDLEALRLGHARQLHVLAVQLLLHDLLQCLEDEDFRFGKGEGLVEFVLELGLGALGSGANGFGIVAVEGTGGFCVVAMYMSVHGCFGDQ